MRPVMLYEPAFNVVCSPDVKSIQYFAVQNIYKIFHNDLCPDVVGSSALNQLS